MEAIIGLSIIGLFVVAVIVVVILGKQRTKRLKQLSESMFFTFDGEYSDEDGAFLQSLGHLALFRKKDQGAWNVMHGKANGVTIAIFDHRYSSGSTNSRRVSEQTVIVFQSDQLQLPHFTMRLESVAHKLSTSILGYRDIDFEGHPNFSGKYHLHGNDEEGIRKVFTDRVVHFFEQGGKWVVDGDANTLMVTQLKKTVAVKDIEGFLAEGFEVFSLFKS